MINRAFFSQFTLHRESWQNKLFRALLFHKNQRKSKCQSRRNIFYTDSFHFPSYVANAFTNYIKNSKSENTRWYHSNFWQCDIRRTGNQIEKNWRRFVTAGVSRQGHITEMSKSPGRRPLLLDLLQKWKKEEKIASLKDIIFLPSCYTECKSRM